MRATVTAMMAGAAVLLMGSPMAEGIPQSFGSIVAGAFGQAAGMPPEEYFSGDAEAWAAGGDLPGDWVAVAGKPKDETLAGKETVFGVVAERMTAMRGADGALTSVRIDYTTKSSGLAAAELKAALMRNVGAFVGADEKRVKDGVRYAGRSLVVTLRGRAAKEGGGLVAVFERP